MIISFLTSVNFLENFIANLFADILVATIFGIVIVKYFEARDKSKAKKEEDKDRKEKLKIAANMLWAEIKYNRTQLKILIQEFPKRNLPYPALETSAWETIDKKIIIDGLKVKDVADLLHIYNRMKTINMMYYSMLDKVNWIEDLKEKPVIKEEFMKMLIDRCKEALKYINEVIPENFKGGLKVKKK